MEYRIAMGLDMVRVSGGWFWMGSEHNYEWERPRHRIWLDAFEIGRFTVTRREYGQFLSDTGYMEPAGWYDPCFSEPDQPVVGVPLADARPEDVVAAREPLGLAAIGVN